MKAIHIHKKIDSETLYLPELKPFVGQTVEIILRQNGPGAAPTDWRPDFWQQLAQGWQGEPLLRPEQGSAETRDVLQ